MMFILQVFGIKGPSWLGSFPEFDIIDGISIDYMHGSLLGVTRLLLKLWLQSQYHEENWYISSQKSVLDDRLSKIQPPDKIQRTPRCLDLVKFWKGQ